jgi:hypothetical protein
MNPALQAQRDGRPGLSLVAQPREDSPRPVGAEYMETNEAAKYLRHSVSWLLRQWDIPFLKGRPNVYRRADLDDWFERHKSKQVMRR